MRLLRNALFLLLPLSLFAQQPVDPVARYYRMICLVHMTGTGTHQDPLRPEHVPTSAEDAAKAGIVAWSVLPTDDKHMAILQLVTKDRRVFDAISNDKRPEVQVFEIGKHAKPLIEAAMKLVRRDFDLATFEVVAR